MTPAERALVANLVFALEQQGAVLARIHEAQGRTLALCAELLKRAHEAIGTAPAGDAP